MEVVCLVSFILSAIVIGVLWLYNREQEQPISALWWWVPCIFLVLFFCFGSFVSVPAGHRGVLLRFDKVEGILGEGLNTKMPLIDRVVMMSVQTQKYEEPATAASKDLQDVTAKVAINYRVDPLFVGELYRTLGVNYIERIAAPAVQEVVKEITARYNAEDMILRRADVKNDITTSLSQRLRERGIITETVNIVDFKFSTVFTSAIESKVAALQAVLEAQNKLERIKIEAQQAQAQAKGEADAAVARAEGQVKAIEILKAALTPEYLQYIYIDKLAKDAKVIVVPQGMPLTLSGY